MADCLEEVCLAGVVAADEDIEPFLKLNVQCLE
jgi:hypothetical protein